MVSGRVAIPCSWRIQKMPPSVIVQLSLLWSKSPIQWLRVLRRHRIAESWRRGTVRVSDLLYASDLNRLPDLLEQKIRTGRYRTAAVGSCNSGNEGPGFTTYHLALCSSERANRARHPALGLRQVTPANGSRTIIQEPRGRPALFSRCVGSKIYCVGIQNVFALGNQFRVCGSRVNRHFVLHRSQQCRYQFNRGSISKRHSSSIRPATLKLDRKETVEERPIAP